MPNFVGIDLSDDYTALCAGDSDSVISVPTVIGRDKKNENWLIGEEAYRTALSGKTVLTDRLIRMLEKSGTATISGHKYNADELLGYFFEALFRLLSQPGGPAASDNVTVCLHEPVREVMTRVRDRLHACGIGADAVSVISHEEAFAHYLLAQEKELYNNMSILFDLSDETLSCYELKVVRGQRRNVVKVVRTDAPDSFHTDILRSEAGRRLGDSIITSAAKKIMDRKIYSSVFLTGRGFRNMDWAREFREFILQRRRVMLEPELFALGARRAAELIFSGEELPYVLFCDTRLGADLCMKVVAGGREARLVLAGAGESWYSAGSSCEFIPSGQNYVDIEIIPAERTERGRVVRAELKDFPERPDRCTRVFMELEFDSARKARIRFRDLGFGSIFPAANVLTEEEFSI